MNVLRLAGLWGMVWLAAGAVAAEAPLVRTVTHRGAERSYYVLLPRDYDPAQTYWPLVVVHGGGGNAEHNAKARAMRAEADAQGLPAIVIMPAFITHDKQVSRFPMLGESDFLEAVLDAVASEFPVHDRILLNGYSMGGQFSHRYALARPERVQACAPFAAGTWTTPDGRLLIEAYGEVRDPQTFLSDPSNAAQVPERLHDLFDARTAAVAGQSAAKGARRVPFLVMCGTLDPRHGIAVAFADALREAGYTVETAWPRTPHGAGTTGEFDAEFAKYPTHAIEFFLRYTQPVGPAGP